MSTLTPHCSCIKFCIVLLLRCCYEHTDTLRDHDSTNDIINHCPLPAAVQPHCAFSWASSSALRLMYSSCPALTPPIFMLHFMILQHPCNTGMHHTLQMWLCRKRWCKHWPLVWWLVFLTTAISITVARFDSRGVWHHPWEEIIRPDQYSIPHRRRPDSRAGQAWVSAQGGKGDDSIWYLYDVITLRPSHADTTRQIWDKFMRL